MPAENDLDQVEICLSAVQEILSRYPNQTAATPGPYIDGLVSLLTAYSPEAISALLHPSRGLATRCKYLPTIADAKEMLEEACADLAKTAERRKLLEPPAPEPDEPPDPEIIRRFDQLKAEIAGKVVRLEWGRKAK